MKKKEWYIVIAIVIVIAVISSFITAKFTGNVIKVPTSTAITQSDVYTKTEIDSIIKSLPYSSGTGTPKNCIVQSFASAAVKNGDEVCKQWTNNKCLISELTLTSYTNKTTSTGYPDLVVSSPRFFKCSQSFTDISGKFSSAMPGLINNLEFQVICCD
jgi:hypothetical protein